MYQSRKVIAPEVQAHTQLLQAKLQEVLAKIDQQFEVSAELEKMICLVRDIKLIAEAEATLAPATPKLSPALARNGLFKIGFF